MAVAIYKKQQEGLIFDNCNGMGLPILEDGTVNGIRNDTGTAGVDNLSNISNNPYPANNP